MKAPAPVHCSHLIAQNLESLATETIEFMIMWFDSLCISYIYSACDTSYNIAVGLNAGCLLKVNECLYVIPILCSWEL